MRCESECFPLGSRCGWDCFATSTQASENGPRLNENAEDEYLLLSDAKTQQRAKKRDR